MKIPLLFCTLFLSLNTHAQDIHALMETNLNLLLKHSSNEDYYKLDSVGLYLYSSSVAKKERKESIFISDGDLPKAQRLMECLSRSEILDLYSSGEPINYDSILSTLPSKPKPRLTGLRVALDPGHMAENSRQAKWEKRYMNIKSGGFFSPSYRFYEAELAYATAYLLKLKLEALGAEVLISRNMDMNALGIPFNKWYKKEFSFSLENDIANGDLDTNYYNWLKTTAKKKEVYRTYFRSKDFEARTKRINEWKPDITLIIHYNADGSGKREAHSKNYCMAFVPGAFAMGELKDEESRIDFLRLMLTSDIKESAKLSHEFIKQHQDSLRIEPVSDSLATTIPYLKKYSVATEYPGVYSRNLQMTRKIKGVLCFGESLLQENSVEAKQLAKNNYCLDDFCTSKRVEQVAEAYFQSVLAYLKAIN